MTEKKGGSTEEAILTVCDLFQRMKPETRQAIAEDIKERLIEAARPEDREAIARFFEENEELDRQEAWREQVKESRRKGKKYLH